MCTRSSLRQSAANDKLYKGANSTTKCSQQKTLQNDQTLQNDELYKATNSTKRQILQNDKLYKTTNSTKRQTQRQSAANARSQVELEREGETTSGAEGGRGKTVGRSAKVEWRVKSSLSSSIPPPAPTPPAPRVHFTIAWLFETGEPEPKILV